MFLEIEKGGEVSTLFVPNLTINLTYLCYGSTKLLVLWEIKKEILRNFKFFYSGNFLIATIGRVIEQKGYSINGNKKGGALLHLFSPNLTMNLTYLCYGSSKIRDGLLQIIRYWMKALIFS